MWFGKRQHSIAASMMHTMQTDWTEQLLTLSHLPLRPPTPLSTSTLMSSVCLHAGWSTTTVAGVYTSHLRV